MHSIDIFVQNYFASNRLVFPTELYYLISISFDLSVYFLAITFCVAFLVYLVRNLKYAILFLASLATGATLVYILKLFFNVSRPGDAVITVFGKSFPSYHATMATIFFVMLMYIFDDYLESTSRVIFNVFCLGSILLIAISRVYLGVHWVSDVAFGVVLGGVVCYFSIMLFKKRKN